MMTGRSAKNRRQVVIPPVQKTPVSLLERLQQGHDQDSWDRFVRLYLPLVCYWGRQVGLQDADVADLAQEVFLLLLDKLPEFRYDRTRSFRHWLRRVTLNKRRELCRRRGLPVDEEAVAAEVVEADPHQQRWEEEHRCYLATQALRLMQTDFDQATWRACWATVVEGRPAGAVAKELGMTVGAVYSARSRVLRRLREELRDLL
jgi:RNA polymerase sigma-70 factor (ECF subfamily)